MLQAVSNVLLYGMRSVFLHAGLLVSQLIFFNVGGPCTHIDASVLKMSLKTQFYDIVNEFSLHVI